MKHQKDLIKRRMDCIKRFDDDPDVCEYLLEKDMCEV